MESQSQKDEKALAVLEGTRAGKTSLPLLAGLVFLVWLVWGAWVRGCVGVNCGTGNRESANGVAGTVASAAAPTPR